MGEASWPFLLLVLNWEEMTFTIFHISSYIFTVRVNPQISQIVSVVKEEDGTTKVDHGFHRIFPRFSPGFHPVPGDGWRSMVIPMEPGHIFHFCVVRVDQPESHPGLLQGWRRWEMHEARHFTWSQSLGRKTWLLRAL